MLREDYEFCYARFVYFFQAIQNKSHGFTTQVGLIETMKQSIYLLHIQLHYTSVWIYRQYTKVLINVVNIAWRETSEYINEAWYITNSMC